MSSTYNTEEAQELIRQILEDPNSAKTGMLSNDLLRQFHRGLPVENLRRFLNSGDNEVTGIGTWIASELGTQGKPLLEDIVELLRHPKKKVRFFAVECVLLWADPDDQHALALAVGLLEDPEPSVRWKVMNILSAASSEQLRGAFAYVERTAPKSSEAAGLRWLLSPDGTVPNSVVAALKSTTSSQLKFAAIAAARISEISTLPLSYASSIPDPDVSDFARFRLSLRQSSRW